jgi:hypothetical protein
VLGNELRIIELKFEAQLRIFLSLKNLPGECVDVSTVEVSSLVVSMLNTIHLKVLLVND